MHNTKLLVKVWFLQKHKIGPERPAGWSERVEEPLGAPHGFWGRLEPAEPRDTGCPRQPLALGVVTKGLSGLWSRVDSCREMAFHGFKENRTSVRDNGDSKDVVSQLKISHRLQKTAGRQGKEN